MNWSWYYAGRLVTRFIMLCTMRVRKLRPHIPDSLPGGYVLAVTHQGHLDPFIASSLQDRPVVWMTRKEFFRPLWARLAITRLNGFCVNRQGVSVSAIRYAVARAKEGHAIGICPEGGVLAGADACFRGGRIKRGLASISLHAQVPIVPCLIIGTARLNNIPIWLPAKWARIWVAYAPPIHPPRAKSTRQTRDALARQVESAYVTLYQEMSNHLALDPKWAA